MIKNSRMVDLCGHIFPQDNWLQNFSNGCVNGEGDGGGEYNSANRCNLLSNSYYVPHIVELNIYDGCY